MTQLHVVRVFIGPGGTGGNLLGVFLNGGVIPPERRMAVTAELGFSESVFVDDVATGRMAIFVPTSELPFAGHPTVGTAWLLGEVGRPVDVLRPPAGDVPTWREGDMTWIGARARWVDFRVLPNFAEFATVEEVDALPDHTSEPWLYAWAWEDEPAGRLRVRSFPTWAGIAEDEAGGAPAVLMGNDCSGQSRSGRVSAQRSRSGRVRIGRSRSVGDAGWSRCGTTERDRPTARHDRAFDGRALQDSEDPTGRRERQGVRFGQTAGANGPQDTAAPRLTSR